MSAANELERRFPDLAAALPRAGLLPTRTPLRSHTLPIGGRPVEILIKHDESSGTLYGGNKVRKLDYLLGRALADRADTVATFGAVGSHHALATALYAHALDLRAVCFLGHQPSREHVRETLAAHAHNRSLIVRFGGPRANRIALLRRHLHGHRARVIPGGGSSWLGVVGFVDAALEAAVQLATDRLPAPERVYVANGTMGTAAGLALGFALLGMDTEVHAIRVTARRYANAAATYRLMHKTAELLHRIDPAFPADLARRVRLVHRDAFVGEGYTYPTSESRDAMATASEHLHLELETTYTAKAFAALIADAHARNGTALFWNTYSSRPLIGKADVSLDDVGLPPDFARYF